MAGQQRRRSSNGQARKKGKANAKSGQKRSEGLPGWLWGLGGLSIGLFVALIVNLELNTDNQDLDRILGDGSNEDVTAADDKETKPADAPRSQEQKPKTADDDSDPDFEFYKVLPEQEVEVPTEEKPPPDDGDNTAEPTEDPVAEDDADESADERTAGTTKRNDDTTSGDKGAFVLQAGSFQELSSADRMKAELALLGVEARIESADLEGGETWHRVRAGPYNQRARVNELRERLSKNDIDTIILRGEP